MIEQQFLSTSTLLDRHEELSKLHLALCTRQKVSDYAVFHYWDLLIQFKPQAVECKAQPDNEAQAQLKQVDTQLQLADTQLKRRVASTTSL